MIVKKRYFTWTAAVLAALLIAGCGGPGSNLSENESAGSENDPGEKPFEGEELRVSTFSFNAELLRENIYDPFMRSTGCELKVEGGKNAERMAKIGERPNGYDVVVISDSYAAQMIENGLIDPIDPTALTNLDALYDKARAPLGEQYGPAYTMTRLGIVYDGSACPVQIGSWEDLWDPRLRGSIAVPDISATTGPLFFYATARMMNLTPGTDDDAIFAKLSELKPNIVKTYTSANDTITMLNQGEISAAVTLDYSYTAARSASEDYVWADPREGTFGSFSTINVVKGCENKELAQAFIDFCLSKEVQLKEALAGVDAPARTDVELTQEQAANFTYGQAMVDQLLWPDWGVINRKRGEWTERWNELFSVK